MDSTTINETRAMAAVQPTIFPDEPVTGDVLLRATERGALRNTAFRATEVRYEPASKTLNIGLADKTAILLPVEIYPEFATLSRVELGRISLGFAGTALCLDSHDLHVSIAGLVSASTSLMDMAATLIASRNGSRSTEAKAAASRENGRKGGRPPAGSQAAIRAAPAAVQPSAATTRTDLYIERRPQGDYAIRKADARRASAIERTQADAIERARKLDPKATVHVERVRHVPGSSTDKWRTV